jgi:hypothetical protein
LNTCKNIGLAVNTRKTKYLEVGRHRGMRVNEQIRIGSNSYERVKPFTYLGSLLTIPRRLRWISCAARMEESRSVFKMFRGKPTRKRASGKPRRKWEDNIRVDLKEIGINTRNWVDSIQDRDYWRTLVNATLNLRVP